MLTLRIKGAINHLKPVRITQNKSPETEQFLLFGHDHGAIGCGKGTDENELTSNIASSRRAISSLGQVTYSRQPMTFWGLSGSP